MMVSTIARAVATYAAIESLIMVCSPQLIENGQGEFTFVPPNTRPCFNATEITTATGIIKFQSQHGFITGDRVRFVQALDTDGTTPTGTLPSVGGATAVTTTDYFIIKETGDSVKLAANLADAEAGTAITVDDAGAGDDHHLAFQGVLSGRARNVNLAPTFGEFDATVLGEQPTYKSGVTVRGTVALTIQVATAAKANRILGAAMQPGQLGDGEMIVYFDNDTALATAARKYVKFRVFLTGPTIDNQASGDTTTPLEAAINGRINGGWESENLYN